MAFNERLKQARKAKKLTQEQLGEIVGVKKATISGYESGKSEPSMAITSSIMNALCIDANYLWQDDVAKLDDNILSPAAHRIGRAYEKATPPVQRTVEVALEPYIDDSAPDNVILIDFSLSEQPASAGTGIYLSDECMTTIRVSADTIPRGDCFGVPVAGDSMEPRYHDGDILIVSKVPVDVGDIGVFTMDGEGYVKQMGRGVLHSLNLGYDDIPLTENIRCNGKVVGVLDPGDICEE